MADASGGEPKLEKVWDLPTRLSKWALVVAVAAAYLLGDDMTFDTVTLHFYAGYAVAGLVAFRLVWGLARSGPSSLSALIPRPAAVRDYAHEMLERRPSYWPGHAPLGSLSVLALLGTLAAVAFTGMCSEAEDFFEAGPLAGYFSSEVNGVMAELHETFVNLLILLVILHLAAVAFYAIWKRENLVRPMVTGWKKVVRRDP